MNRKKSIETVQITVKITKQTYETLRKLSAKENKPLSEIVRCFIDKGLSIQSYKNDIDFIRSQIKEQVTSVLKPALERIIKISIKTGVISAAGYFLNAQVLSELVNPSRRKELNEILEESKKMGVAYFKLSDSEIEKFYDGLR